MSSIYETHDYGYDPSIPEPVTPTVPPRLAELPSEATVDQDWLPPVGKQTMPNCYVWGSVYGLATFWAAQASQTPPTSPRQQGAPDYTYIQVEMAQGISPNTC
jgi:hypothetical protein